MPIDERMVKWDETPQLPKIDTRMVKWDSPTDGMSTLDKALAGAGKGMYDVARGAGQMFGMVSQQDIDEAKRLDAPLMQTTSGNVGNIAGTVAATLPAMLIPGANTVAGAGIVGAGMGAMQPVPTGDSRLQNAAIGGGAGAIGQTAANAIGRLIRPVQSTLSGTDAVLADKAKQFMSLNAAQETGSKPLRWIDSALDNMPFTADKQSAMKMAQREAWQKQLLAQAGENANTATPDVLGGAYTRIGDKFNELSSRNNVVLGNNFINTIAAIDSSKTPFSKGIEDVVNNALDLASKGTLSGKEYQTVRTSLSNASKGAWAQNPELGQALKSLRKSLDDAATASISPTDKAAWEMANNQYKALKTIGKATDTATGHVSPNKLSSEMGRVNPQGMLYGFGDQTMPDLARIGRRFVAEQLPDSGSAQRGWYMNALQNPTAGLGGLLGFLGGGPAGALGGAAVGAATPLAAQRALWSGAGKQYLTQGLLGSPNVQRLAPYGNALSVGLLSN